jgi:hypothetical protein
MEVEQDLHIPKRQRVSNSHPDKCTNFLHNSTSNSSTALLGKSLMQSFLQKQTENVTTVNGLIILLDFAKMQLYVLVAHEQDTTLDSVQTMFLNMFEDFMKKPTIQIIKVAALLLHQRLTCLLLLDKKIS